MLTPFRPEAKSEWEAVHEIVAAVSTSFQGLCVAMLFCFCNGEVISAVQKRLKDSFRSGGRPMRSRSNTHCSSLNTNHHHHHHHNSSCSNNNNNNNQLYRSLGSNSASNGALARAAGGNGGGGGGGGGGGFAAAPLNRNANGSNSSSLLTTLPASPVHQHLLEPSILQAKAPPNGQRPAAFICETTLLAPTSGAAPPEVGQETIGLLPRAP